MFTVTCELTNERTTDRRRRFITPRDERAFEKQKTTFVTKNHSPTEEFKTIAKTKIEKKLFFFPLFFSLSFFFFFNN